MRIKSSIVILASLVGGLTLSFADSTAMAPRTSAYAGVMVNAAADNSVLDFTKRPTLIGDQQYVVGSGSGTDIKNGAFSIKGMMGFNWFGAITASSLPDSIPDLVQLGVANKLFGAGITLGLGKEGSETPVSTTTTAEVRKTFNMDQLGAFGNFRLSPTSDVYGSLGISTDYDGSVGDFYNKFELGTTKSEQTNSAFQVMAGWKKDATTEGTHSLNVEVIFRKGTKEEAVDTGSLVEYGVILYHGKIVKQSAGFGVFAGSTTFFGQRLEKLNNLDNSGLFIGHSPNIEFQKTLGKGFETFSGATVSVTYEASSQEAGAGLSDFTSWELWTMGADVATGLRWNYENFAIEGKIADALLVNGPDMIGGRAPGLYGEVGLAVGF